MDVNLDVFLEIVSVKVKYQVVNKIEPITNYDKRQLICQFRFFQEILNALRVVTVRFTTNSFDLFDLSSFASSLDILKMNFRILTKVNNGTQKVEQSFIAFERFEEVN